MTQRSLSHAEAVTRAELVQNLSYDLVVDLTGGPQTFQSTTTARFQARPGSETFLELSPERLLRATLNGRVLDPAALHEGRLPLADLAEHNTVTVHAEYRYSRSSEGMHRFVDPADGSVYVYAQPSITHAPRFMACFDQPDLKAPLSLTVLADPSWLVRSNGELIHSMHGEWMFAETKPLATYLMTLIAGPFAQLLDNHDGIELGLYARAAYADVLRHNFDEIMTVTKAYLDRFHQLFGVRYPFGKYDQAFVPEFSWGAMEFPGLVVFRDELMHRSAVTDNERIELAAIIAHEMAHMWFGDLVTMRWWDDLWLNESFATYMGYRLVSEVTRWPQAWTRFGIGRKLGGYAADQRPSTHPVAPDEVADTDQAIANFDGISYAKGCSALRQLVAWIGDDAFFSGLRIYFDKHAWGNATLDDLLAALSEASGRDLAGWARSWLRQAGPNTLHPVIEYAPDGSFSSVAVRQTAAASHLILRPHRIGIGWWDTSGVRRRTEVEIDGETTAVPQLAGMVGRGLLLNDGDLTFAKVRLDERTRSELTGLLTGEPDSLVRAVLWGACWDATRDAEWPAGEFVELAAVVLPHEPEVVVIESVLDLAQSAINRFLPGQMRAAGRAAIAAVCRAVLDEAQPGSDRQLAAARGMIDAAGEADGAWLAAWLAGDGAPTGVCVDADLRWRLVGRLAALGLLGAEQVEAEQRRDDTARGRQEAMRCLAALPDPAAKAKAFDVVVREQGLSNRIVVAAGSGLWQPDQDELTAGYVERFFAELPGSSGRSGELLALIAHAAYPVYAVSEQTLALAEQALAGPLHALLRRALLDDTDDLRRALAVRRMSSGR